MKLINIGFGNLVSQERLVAIVSPDSARADCTIASSTGDAITGTLMPDITIAVAISTENNCLLLFLLMLFLLN